MTKFLCLLTLVFFFVTSGSYAGETSLELVLKTESSKALDIIGLNELIARQHRDFPLGTMEISRVVVEAKSKTGTGLISLLIGQNEGTPLRVPANPDFAGQDPKTFFPLKLSAPTGDGSTVWQLKTQGAMKLNRIIVFVKSRSHLSTQIQMHQNLEVVKTIPVNSPVKTLGLKSSKNEILILEARALLANGEEIYLDDLSELITKDKILSHEFVNPHHFEINSLSVRAITSDPSAVLNIQLGL